MSGNSLSDNAIPIFKTLTHLSSTMLKDGIYPVCNFFPNNNFTIKGSSELRDWFAFPYYHPVNKICCDLDIISELGTPKIPFAEVIYNGKNDSFTLNRNASL